MKTRRILLVGEIGAETCGYVSDELMEAETNGEASVNLFITSNGGDPAFGWAMVDLIRRSPVRVVGIASGGVCSAAVDVLVACPVRLSTPSTIFMTHCVKAPSAYARIEGECGRRLWRAQTGMSDATFSRLFRKKDHYFGVTEAVTMGLIHGLLEPGT